MMKLFFGTITAVFGLGANLNASPLKTEISQMMNSVTAHIINYNSHNDPLRLAFDGVRNDLFGLQNSAEFGKEIYPELRNFQDEVERFESAVGTLRKLSEDYNGASEDSKEQKLELLKHGKERLSRFLKDYRWTDLENGKVAELVADLSQIEWKSDIEERLVITQNFKDLMDSIEQTNWDMTHLHGNGIHRFKQRMRWYNMTMGYMKNFFSTHASCGKGAKVPSSAEANGRCLISSCIHSKIRSTYSTFSRVKDAGEQAEANHQPITQALLQPAIDAYGSLRDEKTLVTLSKELEQCIDDLEAK